MTKVAIKYRKTLSKYAKPSQGVVKRVEKVSDKA
jgi:hypothetical protein